MIVVRARGLAKRFFASTSFSDLLRGRLRGRRVEALAGVDLEIQHGEIVGVLGPNGAGKSTLLRLIGALLLPDAGELSVLGQAIDGRLPAGLRRRVSYVVSDQRSFSWRLTGQQNLEFFAALHGLTGEAARERVAAALEAVELTRDADRTVREYSTGMRSRLAFARALLGDPELWLLDELTRGVDPRAAAALRRLVRERLVSGRQATAVVATHDLVEVGQLCSRVVVLDRGRIVGHGAPDEVAELLGVDSLSAAPAIAACGLAQGEGDRS